MVDDCNTYYKGDLTNTKVDAITPGTGVRGVRLVSISFVNPNAAISYIQFFDATAANVTLGTTAPYFTIGVAANSTMQGLIAGRRFATNVCIAATTTATGSSAPASAVQVTLDWI